MKRMIFAAAAALALVMTGCEQDYNGPSADEIGNAVSGKESAQEVAPIRVSFEKELSAEGDLSVGTPIAAWGQTNAAYTLMVNSAAVSSLTLPSSSGSYSYTSSGGGLSGNTLSITGGSTGTTTTVDFKYSESSSKWIEGTLTVTTEYDAAKVDRADLESLKSFFESRGTATTPIADWGQTNAAYTITGTSGGVWLELDKTISYSKVEWKVGTGNTATVEEQYSAGSYTITNNSTSPKNASFQFRIYNRDSTKTIEGTITVTVSWQSTTTNQEVQENYYLESFKALFTDWPSGSSSNNISTFWTEKPISAWAQTDAKYTAQIKPDYGWGSTTLSLPSSSRLTWSYSNTAVSGIDTSYIYNSQISIDNDSLAGASGTDSTITLAFTGSSGTGKTVRGTLVLTVIKQ